MGAAAIGVITTDNARDFVETVDDKTTYATKTIRKFNVDIADVLDLCKDSTVRVSLKKLVEKFKYSVNAGAVLAPMFHFVHGQGRIKIIFLVGQFYCITGAFHQKVINVQCGGQSEFFMHKLLLSSCLYK